MHDLVESHPLLQTGEPILNRADGALDLHFEAGFLPDLPAGCLFDRFSFNRGTLRKPPEAIPQAPAEDHLRAIVPLLVDDAAGGYKVLNSETAGSTGHNANSLLAQSCSRPTAVRAQQSSRSSSSFAPASSMFA